MSPLSRDNMSLRLLLCISLSVCSRAALTPLKSSAESTSGLHCTRTSAVVASVEHKNLDTALDELTMLTNIQTSIGLGQSACFEIYFPSPEQNGTVHKLMKNNSDLRAFNGSLVYSFTFEDIEQHYPVRSQYTFAIPNISTNCICDCPGGDDHCSGIQRYEACTVGDICFTTYHPHQATTGCPLASGEAELCCKVSVSPSKYHPTYTAVQLGSPQSFIRFRYSLHHKLDANETTVPETIEERTLLTPTNQAHTLSLNKHSLTVFINSIEPSRQLSENTYFFPHLNAAATQLRTGLPVNSHVENSVEKLGWLRQADDGSWTIHNAAVKLQAAHHVTAAECKAQKYIDTFDAEFYVSESVRWNQSLGVKLSDYYFWIKDAYLPTERQRANSLQHRQIIVTHRTANPINIDIEIEGAPRVILGFHDSVLDDFDGHIQLDKFSNRYLNATFRQAKGTIIGAVYGDEQRRRVDAVFSTHLNSRVAVDRTVILELPQQINSSRWVCFYPSDKPSSERCRLVPYEAAPLSWFVVPSGWSAGEGDCDGCNEFTVNNFIKYLNPRYWLDGIQGVPEAVSMAVEIGFYAIIVLIALCFCRRIICPVVKWTLKTPKKKRKHTLAI